MNQNYENANVSVAGTKAQVNKNDYELTKKMLNQLIKGYEFKFFN